MIPNHDQAFMNNKFLPGTPGWAVLQTGNTGADNRVQVPFSKDDNLQPAYVNATSLSLPAEAFRAGASGEMMGQSCNPHEVADLLFAQDLNDSLIGFESSWNRWNF